MDEYYVWQTTENTFKNEFYESEYLLYHDFKHDNVMIEKQLSTAFEACHISVLDFFWYAHRDVFIVFITDKLADLVDQAVQLNNLSIIEWLWDRIVCEITDYSMEEILLVKHYHLFPNPYDSTFQDYGRFYTFNSEFEIDSLYCEAEGETYHGEGEYEGEPFYGEAEEETYHGEGEAEGETYHGEGEAEGETYHGEGEAEGDEDCKRSEGLHSEEGFREKCVAIDFRDKERVLNTYFLRKLTHAILYGYNDFISWVFDVCTAHDIFLNRDDYDSYYVEQILLHKIPIW
jgi:PAS domain-containing protein